jgi:hypothetical protein
VFSVQHRLNVIKRGSTFLCASHSILIERLDLCFNSNASFCRTQSSARQSNAAQSLKTKSTATVAVVAADVNSFGTEQPSHVQLTFDSFLRLLLKRALYTRLLIHSTRLFLRQFGTNQEWRLLNSFSFSLRSPSQIIITIRRLLFSSPALNLFVCYFTATGIIITPSTFPPFPFTYKQKGNVAQMTAKRPLQFLDIRLGRRSSFTVV